MDCDQCGQRDAEIKKQTRSGVKPMCGVCVLAREVLMLTRSPPGKAGCEQLHISSRLLGLKLRGEDLTEHVKYIDTAYGVVEQVRKIESGRIYEPGEDFDGKVQGGLDQFGGKEDGG
jgi:hypothetical protein